LQQELRFLDDRVNKGRYTQESGIDRSEKRRCAVSPLLNREKGLGEICAKLACLLTVMIVCAGMDARDPDRAKSVLLDTPFKITLKANPSTGFGWIADYDREYLSLKSKTYTRDPSKPKDWVGVGGHTTFVFVPVKSGRTLIQLHYKRRWEPGASREVTYSVTISPRSR
jgi:predicted secreted protein